MILMMHVFPVAFSDPARLNHFLAAGVALRTPFSLRGFAMKLFIFALIIALFALALGHNQITALSKSQPDKAALHVIELFAILETHSKPPPTICRPVQFVGQLEILRRHISPNGLSD